MDDFFLLVPIGFSTYLISLLIRRKDGSMLNPLVNQMNVGLLRNLLSWDAC